MLMDLRAAGCEQGQLFNAVSPAYPPRWEYLPGVN